MKTIYELRVGKDLDKRIKIKDKQLKRIKKLRALGLTYREIGAVFGVTYSCIYRLLNNIPSPKYVKTDAWRDPARTKEVRDRHLQRKEELFKKGLIA